MLVAVAALFFATAGATLANGGAVKPYTHFSIKTEVSSGGTIEPGTAAISIVKCLPGFIAISGGWGISGSATMRVTESAPVIRDTAWEVEIVNDIGGTPGEAHAVVNCIRLTR
jgi:hypothetical protein